ncbi:type B DNA-directed DNA polymerase [Methanospirillum stamsii]|uniref:DNA-directed DNA polymerase n=1 Tax=Methanospirillum stamsii TaxID=1277351 RepID=A0A2V2NHX9_9EURY|nr:type B DNA-directed DNA polymerase [Methanospirillum stamsii]PWR74943.1 DNA polymerase I [Methanospirillum stamsii]
MMTLKERRFILDICRTKDGVDTWEIQENQIICTHHRLSPEFFFSLPDPHQYYQLLDGLESAYEVTPETIRTIYGTEEGFRVQAGRDVALKIEEQTQYQARLFNVDIRPEQMLCARTEMIPGGWTDVDRFSPDHDLDLAIVEISCSENPHRESHPGRITITEGTRTQGLDGPERTLLEDFFTVIQDRDPDLILFSDYDTWSGILDTKAKELGLFNSLSRTGRFHTVSARSYYSYGRMEHRLGAKIPEGRIIIDSRQSFMHREGSIQGIFLAARLSGLSPNLASRLTPGTLISTYEVYEALKRGYAVPFRKSDAEACRDITSMRLDYRGGYMLQPRPGVYADVTQIDFTSFYPSIIVKENLSPETLGNKETPGFLPLVLKPILTLRHETKARKKTDPSYAGMDGVLKWMLVTCFGYTGYKNARFGRIEVHEEITRTATRLLKECITLTQLHQGEVLHAIIDCLFIQGGPIETIKQKIEEHTGILTECEQYDWVAFLHQADGSGSFTSYFGRLKTGDVKIKGLSSNRRNVPPYVAQMQKELIEELATCTDFSQFHEVKENFEDIYSDYTSNLKNVDMQELIITRRIGREQYKKRCIAQAVLDRYRACGVDLKPGMDAAYLVRDEKKLLVDPSWEMQGFDTHYYKRLLEKAYDEVAGVAYGNALY